MTLNIFITMPEGEIRDSFFPANVVRKLESMASVAWNDTGEQLCGQELKKRIREAEHCHVRPLLEMT